MLKKTLRRYEDIYAPLYEWNLKRWGGDTTTAAFFTAGGLSAGVLIDVAAVAGTLGSFLSPNEPASDLLMMFVFILVLVAHYAMFVRSHRYERLYDRYKQRLSRPEQRKKTRFAWVYLGVSYLGIPLLATAIVGLAG